MTQLQDGQRGLYAHFGKNTQQMQQLIQIRLKA